MAFLNSFGLMEYLAYIIIAAVAGICSGLLGISGGVITVPLLALTFGFIDIPSDIKMHMAIGTSLASMVFNAIASVLVHYKKKNIFWVVVFRMLAGIATGAVLGAFTAYLLADQILQIIFSSFLFILAIYFFRKKDIKPEEHRMPKPYILIILGSVIGYFSNILGIGGGIFLMPLFLFFRLSFLRALGTSVTIGFFSSTLGALSYLYFGMQKGLEVPNSIGFLYLPAFIILSIVSSAFAFASTKFAHKLSQKTLYRLFAIVLVVTSVMMFV